MSSGALARRLERLWYSDSALALLLLPFAALFAVAAGLRRALYSRGWLHSTRVGVPVIVVGNITVGGAGKTPLVAWLAGRLLADGRRPGIVSRGYGGAGQREPVAVTTDSRAEEVGDEPVLLARRTRVPVVVCPERVRAARMLVAAGVDVIIADDGLQHYALARDLEVIVVDGDRRLGNGHLLPAGPLRESARRLQGAPLVVLNAGVRACGDHELVFRLKAGDALALNRRERRALQVFSGEKAWAVAGIGNPERFYAQLRACGIVPVPVAVPDHGRVDLTRLREQADWPILMTEKDAVKYSGYRDVAAWYLPVEVEMPQTVEEAIMHRVRGALPAAVPAQGNGDGGA
ncbi:MAG: tetraacyldisaccharide 4'-kinase [Gammaproteobacteria bacterium]|nr:MAG: tetraacyldisaccharide 4'-kinase [Gammaproteobacteria bacterium]